MLVCPHACSETELFHFWNSTAIYKSMDCHGFYNELYPAMPGRGSASDSHFGLFQISSASPTTVKCVSRGYTGHLAHQHFSLRHFWWGQRIKNMTLVLSGMPACPGQWNVWEASSKHPQVSNDYRLTLCCAWCKRAMLEEEDASPAMPLDGVTMRLDGVTHTEDEWRTPGMGRWLCRPGGGRFINEESQRNHRDGPTIDEPRTKCKRIAINWTYMEKVQSRWWRKA